MSTNLDLAVFRAGLTSLALVASGGSAYTWYQAQPVRYRDYWNVPESQPIPAPMREARRYTAAIDEQYATWKAEIAALSALIDTERPGQFDLAKEIVTADAMKAYVEKLHRLGEATVASFVRMEATARKLDELLAGAPAKYRESAAQMRRYVEETAREDIKQNYMMLADICDAKADAAERHRGDVREHLNTDLLDYLREKNVFLERMLGMLNNGLAPDDLREAARFRDMLKELVTKHEYISNLLRTWRARLQGEPPPAATPEPQKSKAPEPQPEPRKSEDTSGSKTVACETKSERESGAEPSAPLPRVRRVAMLTPTPPAPSPPVALTYWDLVLEREGRWEREVNSLLRIVEELRPAQGIPACALAADPPLPRSRYVEEHWRLDDETTRVLRAHAEKLIGGGRDIESGLLSVLEAGRGLGELLDRSSRPFFVVSQPAISS